MSIHVAVSLIPVKHFDREGLHQLQNRLGNRTVLCTLRHLPDGEISA